MPRVVAVVPAVLLLAALAACSGEASPDPSSSAAAEVDVCATPEGDVAAAIDVSTDVGTAPTVDFEAGVHADETERRVVVQGDGDDVEAGVTVEVAYAVYNGSTGELLEEYGWNDGEDLTFAADPSQQLLGFAKTIGCLPVGTRVVGVVPPDDAFGEEGLEDLGVGPDDDLVVVFDIEGVPPTRAWGADQPAPEGLPTVTLDDDGAPSVEIPETDAPAEFQLGVLKLGDGQVVPEGATVTLQYHGVSWDTGEVFDESWPSPTALSLAQVVPGFAQAIAGQTVGSQVIAVLPPDLAYGQEGESTSALAGQTLVFVIDILGVG